MPVYEYDCAACGAFEDFAPMADYDQPRSCPACGSAAPRALLSVPMLATMGAARRRAYGVNERSANAPETTRGSGRHPATCGCCKPVVPKAGGAKTFPGKRPWMIGH